MANKIKNKGEDLRRKKALFIMLLGHSTFSNLKVLASPTSVSDLSMEELLVGHCKPQTIEIAECFKFFKRMQKPSEQTWVQIHCIVLKYKYKYSKYKYHCKYFGHDSI